MGEGIKRRDFLKIAGAAGASAALGACAPAPQEKIIPYVIPPDEIIPGVAAWYATVCRECPAGCGVLVKTREGRAIKIEGNPAHPVSRGGLCIRGQAVLQGLYNPDRIRTPLKRGASRRLEPVGWDQAVNELVESVVRLRSSGDSRRIAVVTPLLGGSLGELFDRWARGIGAGLRLSYEPFAHEPLRAACRIAFGREAIPNFNIAGARFLLSFGADFLETWLSNVAYARDFSKMHGFDRDGPGLFFHVGPRLGLTAANADRWLEVRPGSEGLLAPAMINVILNEGLNAPLPGEELSAVKSLVSSYTPEAVAARTGIEAEEIIRLARLFASRRPSLALGGGVTAGGRNATAIEMAVLLLNYIAGNIGKTVRFGPDSALSGTSSYADMLDLVEAMRSGEVSLLFIYDSNPAFTLPASSGFAEAMGNVKTIAFSSFMDETTERADLVLPVHTPLESWGDYSPEVGVHGLMQPAMRPLFDTRHVGDLLLETASAIEGFAEAFEWFEFKEFLQEKWRKLHERLAPEKSFEVFWAEALRRGGVWEKVEAVPVKLSPALFSTLAQSPLQEQPVEGSRDGLSLIVYPSIRHYDGRGANRPWLQEIADPMTKVAWEGWVELNPETAGRLGISEGDLVSIESPHGRIELPALLYPGIHEEAIAVPLGQGHSSYGRYASGVGANPMALLPAEPEKLSGGVSWLSVKVKLSKPGGRRQLPTTQGERQQLGRAIAQATSAAALEQEAHRAEPEVRDIYPAHEHAGHRWGMAIDLDACIGCNACVAACYAENNIPVVGREQVARGRVMSWIRVERYFESRGESRFVPMLCQQCDYAPCEPVCPVYATYHNPEGLSAQVYNRCVGTRYCSNNCPYKVRYFNWFDHRWDEPLQLQLNPDVTVRTKGVMEKCTFCIQRINHAKDVAKDEGRGVRDGEIAPACAQSCPAEAIVFGDLNDPESRVAKLARDPRRYHILEELNTKPAITYLKKVVRHTI